MKNSKNLSDTSKIAIGTISILAAIVVVALILGLFVKSFGFLLKWVVLPVFVLFLLAVVYYAIKSSRRR